jgi:hypothetical protein
MLCCNNMPVLAAAWRQCSLRVHVYHAVRAGWFGFAPDVPAADQRRCLLYLPALPLPLPTTATVFTISSACPSTPLALPLPSLPLPVVPLLYAWPAASLLWKCQW